MLPHVTSFLLFLAAAAIKGTVAQNNFDWDCTKSLGTCNNACYAIYRGKAPSQLTYDSNAANRPTRRTASGCNRNPCNNNALTYSRYSNSCDEYPFASTTQGGTGAILRCVDSSENSSLSTLLDSYARPGLDSNSGV